MNENNMPAAPEQKNQPKYYARHHLVFVPLIAFGLLTLGQLLGELATFGVSKAFGPFDAGVSFLMMYLTFLGIDIVMILYCLLAEKPILRSLGPASRGGDKGNTWGMFGLGLLVGFGMNGICILLAWLHGDIDLSMGRFEAVYLFFALVSVCVQSAAEEIVTRGYMMGALRAQYPVWVAIAGNSLFFGLLHLANPRVTVLSIAQIVLIGLLLSLIVYYQGSLWMCIAIHTAWNFTQNFLFGLPNSGIVAQRSFFHLEGATNSLFYDAGFGIEGSITGVIVILLVMIPVVLLGRRAKKA